MKNKTLLFLILAAAAAWYFFVYRKRSKHPTGAIIPVGGGSTNAGVGGLLVDITSETPAPETPATNEVVTKTETGDCPYCGTRNARITRHIQNGKVIKMEVMCGNKSCPGSMGGKIKTAESMKIVQSTSAR